MSCLSLLVKIGKLKRFWPRARQKKILKFSFLKNNPSRGPNYCSLYRQSSWGKGNASIWAFMIEARTLVFTGVEILIILKQAMTSAVILGGVKFVLPLGRKIWLPIAFVSVGVLAFTIVFLRTGSSSIMMGSPSISSLVLPLLKIRDENPFNKLSLKRDCNFKMTLSKA